MTRRRAPRTTEPALLPAEVMPYVLMDPKQTASFLGTTPATLADWRNDGLGPPYCKVGALVRYQFRNLQAWLNDRMVNTRAS